MRSEKALATLAKTTEVDFVKTPLADALALLCQYHGIVVNWDVESLDAAKVVPEDIPVTLHLNGVTFHAVLQKLLEPANLGYFVDEVGLVITTKEKAAGANAAEKPPTRDAEKPPRRGAAKEPSLDIIVAQHVILWDGEIVTWDQVVKGLQAMRKERGEPLHPKFRFTKAAIDLGKSQAFSGAPLSQRLAPTQCVGQRVPTQSVGTRR
jgi:hypothetical protein